MTLRHFYLPDAPLSQPWFAVELFDGATQTRGLLFMNLVTFERRRLTPVPAGGRTFDEAGLAALLDRGHLVSRGAGGANEPAKRASAVRTSRELRALREQLDVERTLRKGAEERLRRTEDLMNELADDVAFERRENERLNLELQGMSSQFVDLSRCTRGQ